MVQFILWGLLAAWVIGAFVVLVLATRGGAFKGLNGRWWWYAPLVCCGWPLIFVGELVAKLKKGRS